ncbi:MAG: N-acetyl-gamma-glutamyl-phosphate reductase [Gemmatimonadota bacterium]
MKVSVIGAAGYAGGELLRILLRHPGVRECTATSRSQAGELLGVVHPGLSRFEGMRFQNLSPGEASRGRDVVLLALEHGQSSRVMPEILAAQPGLVIDLGADFRVHDLARYEKSYGSHEAPDLVSRFCYGLADVRGADLHGAKSIASPGCFATAAALALFPLAGIPEITASLFAITGSSGSGVHPRPTTHHPARAHNVFAYSPLGHRHEAEINEQWQRWTGGGAADVRLLAHSGPFVRGIYLTLHARWPGKQQEIGRLFNEAYRDRPFVRVVDAPPELTHVVGSNDALISVTHENGTNEAQISVAIDNLIKGAGGQAVQSMNLALALPETDGLLLGGMFPC